MKASFFVSENRSSLRHGSLLQFIRSRYRVRVWSKGYSLLELLIVIAILLALLAKTLPVVDSFANARRINLATGEIVDEFNFARAVAFSRNLPAEVCFLRLPDYTGSSNMGYRAVQTRIVEADGTFTWISKVQRLPETVVFSPSLAFSSLIATQTPAPLKSGANAADGVAIRIYPSGRTERVDETIPLPSAAPHLFVTIGLEREVGTMESSLPSNFSTIQINPRDARVATHRR